MERSIVKLVEIVVGLLIFLSLYWTRSLVKLRPLTCQAANQRSILTLIDQCLTMRIMSERITVRLDTETMHVLRELQKRSGSSKSEVIRSALRHYWGTVKEETGQTAWEVYQQLYPLLERPQKGQPLHDRAQHVSRLLKEKLIAKRRNGTL